MKTPWWTRSFHKGVDPLAREVHQEHPSVMTACINLLHNWKLSTWEHAMTNSPKFFTCYIQLQFWDPAWCNICSICHCSSVLRWEGKKGLSQAPKQSNVWKWGGKYLPKYWLIVLMGDIHQEDSRLFQSRW